MDELKAKRVPKCGFCQNHGIKNPLRAHKRDCKFYNCPCKLCVNTRLRREHMADMQYIKRNGVVELERIQNEQDAQAKKKDIYVKIFQERMANKNKKRLMKDLKSGNGSDSSILATGSSNSLSPNSTINENPVLPSQLANLARAFTNNSSNSLINNLSNNNSKTNNLDTQTNTLADLNTSSLNSINQTYKNLFLNPGDPSKTSDQIFKAVKLLGIGLNSNASPLTSNNLVTFNERLRNEDLEINDINEFIEKLAIVNCFNNDEKILNAAICILFNGIPLALLNPGDVADEIFSAFKHLCSTNMFR